MFTLDINNSMYTTPFYAVVETFIIRTSRNLNTCSAKLQRNLQKLGNRYIGNTHGYTEIIMNRFIIEPYSFKCFERAQGIRHNRNTMCYVPHSDIKSARHDFAKLLVILNIIVKTVKQIVTQTNCKQCVVDSLGCCRVYFRMLTSSVFHQKETILEVHRPLLLYKSIASKS